VTVYKLGPYYSFFINQGDGLGAGEKFREKHYSRIASGGIECKGVLEGQVGSLTGKWH
jgi:hypothetical protein